MTQNEQTNLTQTCEEGLLEASSDKEALKAYMTEKNTEVETYKKQAMDMRKKLSKGVVIPDSIEKYHEAYIPEEKYAPFYAMEPEEKNKTTADFVKTACTSLDKLAFDNGMTLQQTAAVKHAFNALMEDLGILDTRAPEEVNKQHREWIQSQKQELGEEAEKIISENVKFYNNFNGLDEDDKELVRNLMNQGARGIKLFNRFRTLLMGNRLGDDIPGTADILDTLPDDMTLAQEYNAPGCTAARRFQIIQQRQAAGRKGGLPFIAR